MNDNPIIQMMIDSYVEQIKTLNGGQLPESLMQKPEPSPIMQQSSAANMPKEAELLVMLYDEFLNTDDGKALAAGLGKFARFVQSKVDASGQQKTSS